LGIPKGGIIKGRGHHLETPTFDNLIKRLSRAGFKKDFVREALLPDWWDESGADDPSLLPELEIRVARFFGVPVASMRHPRLELSIPNYPGARLRKVANLDRNRVKAAVHTGLQIAAAVVRSLRDSARAVRLPPADPMDWYREVQCAASRFDLASIVNDLWERGIPVVHVDVLPAPKFQALACLVGGRPVIVLGHANDAPPRLAFHIAHEVGHVVHDDCGPDAPIIDEDESVVDSSTSEQLADEYAWNALAGGEPIGDVPTGDHRDWAKMADEVGRQHSIDAGVVVWSWANRTKDFKTGQMALKALYRSQRGQRMLRAAFDRNVDLENAAETDRALLRCLFLDPERDAPTHR
jgi:hypothetical protein